jgi:hypothetical protein
VVFQIFEEETDPVRATHAHLCPVLTQCHIVTRKVPRSLEAIEFRHCSWQTKLPYRASPFKAAWLLLVSPALIREKKNKTAERVGVAVTVDKRIREVAWLESRFEHQLS